MALDLFGWCTQLQGGGGSNAISNSVVGIQFGNGYRQVIGAGFNTTRNKYQIVYAGEGEEYAAVRAFVLSHITTPFAWKMPNGQMGVFRVMEDTVTEDVLGETAFELKCTFEEHFTAI